MKDSNKPQKFWVKVYLKQMILRSKIIDTIFLFKYVTITHNVMKNGLENYISSCRITRKWLNGN